MIEGKASRTALAVAGLRAAHQVIEGGAIFSDPLAVRIVGEQDLAVLQQQIAQGDMQTPVRLCVAARTRAAEDALAEAVARGVGQLVVLGAGLDSFAYRNPYGARLVVFEVDHPATQQWKLERLAAAGIAVPETVRHVAVDFETQQLVPALVAAGFDAGQPSFVIWLGVVYYLTEAATLATLRDIAGFPGGVELAVDYLEPVRAMNTSMQAVAADVAARVSAVGETLMTFFTPAELHARLAVAGFAVNWDKSMTALAQEYMPSATLPPDSGAAHVLVARRKEGLLY